MNLCVQNDAQKRYLTRSWLSGSLVILLAITAKAVLISWSLHGVIVYPIAVLPALPIVWMLVATGAYLAEEKDEFVRMLLVKCLLSGIGGTLALTTVWAYLEDFARAPRLDLIWVYPIFWACVWLSYPVVKARYR